MLVVLGYGGQHEESYSITRMWNVSRAVVLGQNGDVKARIRLAIALQ